VQVGFIGAGNTARALPAYRIEPNHVGHGVIAFERDGVRAAFAGAMDDVVGG
jgi:pyrroline-5-carboxylate reductase